MYATKKTPSPLCIVCNRLIYKENERYRLYKVNEERLGFSAGQKTMVGVLLEKVATGTETLSIVKARHLNHVCSICRNVLVKVQRAQKHLEDAHKEYCTRLQLAQRADLQPIMLTSPVAHDRRILQGLPSAANLPALVPSKHARPLFSPSGVSPAAKRPSLHQKATPDVQPSQFSPSGVSPAAKRPTLSPIATPDVPSPRRSRSTLHLRDLADRPMAARSLTFGDASSVVQEVREIRVYTDLDDDTDEDIKV